MTKLTIALTRDEMEKLRRAARNCLRQPHDQARYILRSALLGESPPAPPVATHKKSAVYASEGNDALVPTTQSLPSDTPGRTPIPGA